MDQERDIRKEKKTIDKNGIYIYNKKNCLFVHLNLFIIFLLITHRQEAGLIEYTTPMLADTDAGEYKMMHKQSE